MLRLRPTLRTSLPARGDVGGPLRLRHRLVRADGHYNTVHASAISVCANSRAAIPRQHQPGLPLVCRPDGSGHSTESELRTRPGRFRSRSQCWVRLFATMELHSAKGTRPGSQYRSGLSLIEEYAPGLARMELEPV